MLSVNLSNIAISKIQGADYCVIISGISKSEAANLPQADLNKNSTILEVVKIIKKFKVYLKRIRNIKFGDIEIQTHKFHQHKKSILINNIDIYEIVVSNKASLSKKGFKILIGYKGGKNVRPLCILLPEMSAYRKDFDETKYMSLLIKEYELLEKYNEIWEKVSNSMKK